MRKKYIFTLFLLAAAWGSDFMFIKVGITTIAPSLFTSLRFLLAMITLFIFIKFKKLSLKISVKDLNFIVLISIIDVYLPQILITSGEKSVESSIASIILSSSPIFTFIFAHLFLEDEKINLYKFLFIIFGFIGVLIIFYDKLIDANKFTLTGLILITLASISYGLGVILLKKINSRINIFTSCFYLNLFAFFISIPIVIIFNGIKISAFDLKSILSQLYVGIVLQAFSYTFFLNAIRNFGASDASYVGYLVPFFSIIYGFIFLKEILTMNIFIGALLIILSAYFIERINSKKRAPWSF